MQAEFDVFNSQTFDESICPTCKQPLPADKQAELEADFNSNKAEKLEEYQQLIESAKTLKANYEEQQEVMAVKADGLVSQIEQINGEYEVKFKEYESYYEPNIEDDPEYKGLKAELFLLELDDNDDADTKRLTRLESET